jgi:hypothetical protein
MANFMATSAQPVTDEGDLSIHFVDRHEEFYLLVEEYNVL